MHLYVCHNCRSCCQQPASSSWWMFVRFAVSSCSLSFTPPTVWASEPSLTCTHAHSFSTRPTHSPVSFSVFTPQVGSRLLAMLVSPALKKKKCVMITFRVFVSLRAAFHWGGAGRGVSGPVSAAGVQPHLQWQTHRFHRGEGQRTQCTCTLQYFNKSNLSFSLWVKRELYSYWDILGILGAGKYPQLY